MKILAAFGVLIAVAAWAVQQGGGSDNIVVKVIAGKPAYMCEFNSLSVAPGGSSLLLYKRAERFLGESEFNGPSSAVYVRYAGYDKLPDAAFTTLGGDSRLQALGWNFDKPIIRVGRGHIVSYDWHKGQVQPLEPLPTYLQGFSEISLGPRVDLSSLSGPEIEKISERGQETDVLLRGRLYAGAPSYAAYADLRHQLRLRVVTEQLSHLEDTVSSIVWKPDLYSSRIPSIGYLGSSDQAYARPLISSDDGRKVGFFVPQSISGIDGAEEITKLLRSHYKGDYFIRHAVASQGSVYMLIRFQGEVNLVKATRHGIAANVLCAWKNLGPYWTKIMSVEYGVRLDPASPIVANFYKPFSPRSKRLIVFFHGGPASTVYGEIPSNAVTEMLALGFDVLAVEYSGSAGAGQQVFARLPRGGVGALHEDIEAIKKWIAPRGYESVDTIGESFGAVPAMVALETSRKIFRSGFFISPLVSLKASAVNTQASGVFGEASDQGQEQFERAVFSGAAGRERFRTELDRLVRNFRPSTRDVFLFGALDTKSGREDLPPLVLRTAKVAELEKTTHEWVSAKPETWKMAKDWAGTAP